MMCSIRLRFRIKTYSCLCIVHAPHKYALQSVVLIFLISELICGLREVLTVAPINRFLALGG
jgi:hypothetical protein